MGQNGELFITFSNLMTTSCTTPNLNQANGGYFMWGANDVFSGGESLGNCWEFPFPSKVINNVSEVVDCVASCLEEEGLPGYP